MSFRVIGLIKVVPASKFRSDWSYKSQIRKNELLQILYFEPEKNLNFFSSNTHIIRFFPNFRVIGLIAVMPAQNVFRVIGLIATHDSGLIATHVSGLITTPCRNP